MTVALSSLDGYDVLSATFAAPAVAQAWGIGKAALGVLMDMALGYLVLAPLADIVGRWRLVLTSLIVMATGMLLSAFAPTLRYLVMWRVLTELGIGAMVAVINPLAAEFANKRHRPLALALVPIAMGYPIGGLGSAVLLRLYGWQAVFLAGAVVAAMLVPIVLYYLPEPLAFLLARQRDDALVRVNALLQRCGKATVRALPPYSRLPPRWRRAG